MTNFIKIRSPIHISLERGTKVQEDIKYFIHNEISNDITLGNEVVGRYVLERLDIYIWRLTEDLLQLLR